jgi:non-specific serine/threonine protein kinase
MSDSKQEALLDHLRAYPLGQIYTIAPKHFVVRGFDYYRHGSLFSFEWTDDLSSVTARVKGSRTYLITITADGHGLGFHCDCPAWTPSSNCKHVICTLFTIKNLLEPAALRVNGGDEERKDVLLGELCSEPHHRPLIVRKEAAAEGPISKKSGYSIVFSKTGHLADIYVRKDGEKLKHYTGCPYELRQFVLPAPYYLIGSRLLDLERFLGKYGNKYPFILDIGENERQVRFDDDRQYTAATELDAYSENVTVSKMFINERRKIPNPGILGNLLFDADSGIFSHIRGTNGWQLWNETASLLYDLNSSEEALDDDDTSFSIPLEMFQTRQLVFPSSDGDTPLNVVVKTEGKEAQIIKPAPSHRITISQAPGANLFTLRAECIVAEMSTSPTFKIFSFLISTANGLISGLSAYKRRRILCRAFFDMLGAGTTARAETIIKKELALEDFSRYSLKKKARELLRRHLAFFYQAERRLLLKNMQWISFEIDKVKELSLYRIPYEIFGWEIFREMPFHDVMTVTAERMSEGLPLLYERLKAEGIGLFFNHEQVKMSSWEFSFDATRPGNIDWFEIRPEIRCDGELMDEETWQRVLVGKGIDDNGACVRILDANSRKVFSMISDIYKAGKKDKSRQKEIVKVPRLQILDWIMLRKSGVKVKLPPEDEEIISRLATLEKLEARPLPARLRAKLRHYQKEGYAWLSFLYENRFGACLADDMGLGKTIQAISLMAGIREKRVRYACGNDREYPHLVVLPPSLLFNWESEIKRFYPDLRIVFYTGKQRNTSFEGYGVVLTTYALVRRDLERLKDIQFDVIVFDEAQAVKNMLADVTGAARQLKGRFKLAMTGTPLENHVGEYYSIIDLSIPGLLGEYDEFRPLIKQEASQTLDRIIRRTRPFVLRRTKEKILKELPPKTETDIYLDLTEKQKALYKKTVEQIRTTIDNAYSTKTQQQAQIIALTAILKLRQLCVSPKLLSSEITDPSPKIVFLIESLKELLEEDHAALVFSQFTSFLDVLEEDLKRHGIRYLRLDGSTPVVKRKKLIETFQQGEGPSVFLLSLKAGGQGLNLTKASYVFHLDPWWNPAVENQASDRAHRIGQKKNVTITRILMRHTIEEKMMELKKRKLELYKAVMEDSGRSRKGFSITKSDFNFLLG